MRDSTHRGTAGREEADVGHNGELSRAEGSSVRQAGTEPSGSAAKGSRADSFAFPFATLFSAYWK